MVKLLNTRKKFSIAQLSERLEVSPRMIRKYKQDDYLNFPENRIWYAKKIVGLDKKICALASAIYKKHFNTTKFLILAQFMPMQISSNLQKHQKNKPSKNNQNKIRRSLPHAKIEFNHRVFRHIDKDNAQQKSLA